MATVRTGANIYWVSVYSAGHCAQCLTSVGLFIPHLMRQNRDSCYCYLFVYSYFPLFQKKLELRKATMLSQVTQPIIGRTGI